MTTQDESIDLASIKAAALGLSESPYPPTLHSELSRADRLEAIQNAFYRSVAATTFADPISKKPSPLDATSQPAKQVSSPEDSLPYHPSTVPESAGASNVDSDLQPTLPFALQSQVLQAVRKMSSQGALQDTQPLSPGVIASIISKSKPVVHATQGPPDTENAEEGHGTLREGDEGHVDLLSSYPDAGEVPNEEVDPEPVNFSPTQTQHRLSQFPESQRFKTPATIGKKRKYNGELDDSPALPRNPIVRKGDTTPAKTMGLSQAFAATQAGSSPFLNRIPSELPSDRPSPNIGLQARPATAPLSSPLVPKSDLKRATAEPYDRYVSLRQSQAGRKKPEKLPATAQDLHVSDDDFPEENSWVELDRRKRERETKARAQFDALSSTTKRSPRSENLTMSSPIRKGLQSSLRFSPKTYGRRNGHVAMPRLFSDQDTVPDLDAEPNDSEAETEPEDDREAVLRRFSQQQRGSAEETDLEEDKENAVNGAIQVPETTLRLQHVTDGFAEVEASPSARHSGAMASSPRPSQMLEGLEHFAVADSQPSQSRRRQLHDGAPKVVSSGQGTEVVPQSQPLLDGTNDILGGINDEPNSVLGDAVDAADKPLQSPAHLASSSQPTILINQDKPPVTTIKSPDRPDRQSTIPETSPAKFKDLSTRVQHNQPFTVADKASGHVPLSGSASDFETAPTHVTTSSGNASNLPLPLPPSSKANPVSQKRRRMADIAADPSPQKSSGPDLNVMLATVQDPDFDALIGDSSPIPPGRNAKKRRLNLPKPVAIERVEGRVANDQLAEKFVGEPEWPLESAEAGCVTPVADRTDMNEHHEDLVATATGTPEEPAREATRRTTGRSRQSRVIWEPQATPEKSRPVRIDIRVIPTDAMASTLPAQKKNHARIASQSKRCSRMQMPIAAPAKSSSGPRTSIGQAHASPESELRDAPAGDIVAPNQVFACFNGKSRAYYPAACLGVSDSNTMRFQIQWEGYDPDEIDAHGVRRLDLRTGDAVKVNLEGFPKVAHVIRGFKDLVSAPFLHNTVTDVRGYKNVLVAPKQRNSLPANLNADAVKEVPVAAIYLDSNMWGQMKDRTFEYTPVLVPQLRDVFSTPAERPSTPNTPSSRHRRVAASLVVAQPVLPTGLFSNMVFAISYDDSSRKNSLAHSVKSNGGIIVTEGFHELLDDEMSLKPRFAALGFTALLADRHSRKEKYMQAVALNLPCLGGRWVEACLAKQELIDWQPYLLPAGESQELEGAIRSRTLPNIDVSTVKLHTMIAARPSILNGANIILVTGRGKAEEKRKPYLFLAETLGASKVEKATDLHAAKALADTGSFHWIFVDDHDVQSAKMVVGKQHKNVRVAGNQLIVQSLILGRLYEG